MFDPEDTRKTGRPFDEPWQAQALGMADLLVRKGVVDAVRWSEALGAALRRAEDRGAPDTAETYFLAVVETLEAVTETDGLISRDERSMRRAAWEDAYRQTPHGEPVVLPGGAGVNPPERR